MTTSDLLRQLVMALVLAVVKPVVWAFDRWERWQERVWIAKGEWADLCDD